MWVGIMILFWDVPVKTDNKPISEPREVPKQAMENLLEIELSNRIDMAVKTNITLNNI